MQQPSTHIADIRKDYRLAELDEAMAGGDPILFFKKWFSDAEAAEVLEVNAMTLATVDHLGMPHARIVLLKEVQEQGFVFFTNYHSHKGADLDAVPQAALVFFWPELERQVRIEGQVVKLPTPESDAYFESRPEGSRIGAWASPQSEVITDRKILEQNYSAYASQFPEGIIPRPAHWGGYCVEPLLIEFWQGRSSRMHDRIVFSRPETEGSWKKYRLAP